MMAVSKPSSSQSSERSEPTARSRANALRKVQTIQGRRRAAQGAIWVFPLQTDVSLGNSGLMLEGLDPASVP